MEGPSIYANISQPQQIIQYGASHNFVDPTTLNAGQPPYINGQYQPIAQRPYQSAPFFQQSGSTIDPRSLQGQQAILQPTPQPNLQQQAQHIQPGKQIHPFQDPYSDVCRSSHSNETRLAGETETTQGPECTETTPREAS